MGLGAWSRHGEVRGRVSMDGPQLGGVSCVAEVRRSGGSIAVASRGSRLRRRLTKRLSSNYGLVGSGCWRWDEKRIKKNIKGCDYERLGRFS